MQLRGKTTLMSNDSTRLIQPTIFKMRFSERKNKPMIAKPVMINDVVISGRGDKSNRQRATKLSCQ